MGKMTMNHFQLRDFSHILSTLEVLTERFGKSGLFPEFDKQVCNFCNGKY